MTIKKSWGGQNKLCSVYNAKQGKETLALKPVELQSFRRYVAALGASAVHFPLYLVTLRKGMNMNMSYHTCKLPIKTRLRPLCSQNLPPGRQPQLLVKYHSVQWIHMNSSPQVQVPSPYAQIPGYHRIKGILIIDNLNQQFSLQVSSLLGTPT